MREVKWKSDTIIWTKCGSTVSKQFDLLGNTLKCEKGRDVPTFILTHNWKLNIAIIKIIAKKKKKQSIIVTDLQSQKLFFHKYQQNIDLDLGITTIM